MHILKVTHLLINIICNKSSWNVQQYWISLNEDPHFNIKCNFLFTGQCKCNDHIKTNWVIKFKKDLFGLNALYVKLHTKQMYE